MTWALNFFNLSFFLCKVRVVIRPHRLGGWVSEIMFRGKLITKQLLSQCLLLCFPLFPQSFEIIGSMPYRALIGDLFCNHLQNYQSSRDMFHWLVSGVSVVCACVYASVCAQSLSYVWLVGLWLTRLLCPWNSPGKNTGVYCYSLLQEVFLTQGLKPHLTTEPPWKWISMEDPSKDNISRE